jgi:hypothetical protein
MGTDQVVIRDFAYSTKSNLLSSPNTVTDPTEQEGFEGFSSPNEGSGLSPEDRSRVNRNEDGSYQVRGGTQTSGSNWTVLPPLLAPTIVCVQAYNTSSITAILITEITHHLMLPGLRQVSLHSQS